MNFTALALLCFTAEMLAYPVAPVAVAFATADGRLPRWARWWETHDNLGWTGPLSEGYPATKWGLVRWLWRNKAYTLRWKFRALPDYPTMVTRVRGGERPRWGYGYRRIDIWAANGHWFYARHEVGLGRFSVWLDAGWKLQGFLEGARPGANDRVSTGNFLGVGLRTDDFGDN